MNRVKKTEDITDSQEDRTMQDFSYSTESFSPSFSFYVSGDGEIVEAAVRVVRESYGDDTAEFEFETLPLHEENFFHFPTTTETKSFNSSPEEDGDDVAAVANRVTSKNLLYGGWILDQSISSPSQSPSSSESEDSEDLSPGRYSCFWSPTRSPARVDSSKSKTSSAPRRCRITDLLRRSHSDGAVSTTSEPKRCRFKDLLRRSHSDGRGSGSLVSPSGNSSPAVRGRNKTTSNKYTNTGEVNMRRKTYLPYRQDLIGVFAGMSRLSR
ncbi:unnamed protein product [Brassica rapa]|uniref:Uncharacterized protein n=1 Tax=Brassica campestris TaxID=3711 RepID=A0A3P6DKI9_BRACM|nr:unnamed protein product [Brassica rapa]VDD19579.1 unnamed protein product [Brassica rapa]